MKILYTDAGYTWQNTEKTEEGKPIIGRICVSDGEGFTRVEMVAVGRVPNLKQYINIFELVAVARAVEIAIEKGWIGSLAIYTDSMVAKIWASNGVGKKVETEAHRNAYNYLKQARANFAGVITYNHVLRDHNPAGKVLETELEKDRVARETAEEKVEKPNNDDIITDLHENIGA